MAEIYGRLHPRPLPDQQLLLKILDYTPETGEMHWLPRSVELFERKGYSAKHCAAIWNGKHAGRLAFVEVLKGYRYGSLFCQRYYAHRVIWRMVYGSAPDTIDHIDGDPLNNRIENLRSVRHVDNQRNMKLSARNSSGISGVSWFKPVGQWRAYITVDGKQISLGYHSSIEAAGAARCDAERRYGFHSNHGKARA